MSIVKGFEEEEGRELPKPICFTGDLTSEFLGLDDFAMDWFEQNCGAVLHNAASIRFHAPDGDRSKDPYLSNVGGTQNVLDVCKAAGIEEFHHVSTAYVSGARTDRCYEHELDVGQDFVNDYQVSKVEAEKLIRGCDFIKSLTVYRPGLVVGDSRTGFTTAPDFGLYHYIQFNTQIMKTLRSGGATGTIQLPFRLRFTGNELRNIVTVDWVADAIFYLVTHSECHGTTYNLTPDEPITSRKIVEALVAILIMRESSLSARTWMPPSARKSKNSSMTMCPPSRPIGRKSRSSTGPIPTGSSDKSCRRPRSMTSCSSA